MATKKSTKAKKSSAKKAGGKNIDRWTSNGYGIQPISKPSKSK